MPGLFEALGGALEGIRGFLSGIFGRGVEEGVSWPDMSDLLSVEGLEQLIPDLSPDFHLQEDQAEIARGILEMPGDYLIPVSLHLETDRLLPHKFVYEVDVAQFGVDGSVDERPYYVGSDRRLTQDEILEIADGEAENSPAEGAIAYEIGGIRAAWMRVD